MPQLDLPDYVMVHSNNFIAFLNELGLEQEWEPQAAVPLLNTQGCTIIMNDQIPEDTTYLRKRRQWYKVRILPPTPSGT